MSVLQPFKGKLTFSSEGAEKGFYHSRVLHVPSATSGLTIGRGYDMKLKDPIKIKRELIFAGLKENDASLLSKASRLSGNLAKSFICNNKLEKFEITQQAQVKLFDISYKEEEAETKRLCTKRDVEIKYGKCNWDKLDSAIKEVLIDLKFRGDYSGDTRTFIQKYVVANDSKGFLKALSERTNWVSLWCLKIVSSVASTSLNLIISMPVKAKIR